MENAAKALLMAGGILIGILILALMVTLFESSRNLSDSYESTKKQEAIQQFNTNFTKYLGQDITIHDVLTICNFAKENGFVEGTTILKSGSSFNLNSSQIDKDLKEAKKEEIYQRDYLNKKVKVDVFYKLELEYDSEGIVSKIKFSSRHIEKTELP